MFADVIPTEDKLEQPVEAKIGDDTFWSQIRRQAQLTVLAFKTGVSVSADLWLGGFGHSYPSNGRRPRLAAGQPETDGVDYLWEYAEQHGIADRLLVVIGSDFGRTNFYNADDGKDHWPICSYVIMRRVSLGTNRPSAKQTACTSPRKSTRKHSSATTPRHNHLPEARA